MRVVASQTVTHDGDAPRATRHANEAAVGRQLLDERLTRSGPLEIVDAHRHLREVVLAARAVHDTLGHLDLDAPAGHFRIPGAVAEHPQAHAVLVVARQLAAVDVTGITPMATPAGRSPDVVILAFERALVRAVDAVRVCRQTAHPGGSCWFRPTPSDAAAEVDARADCGTVLRLAHQL